MKEKLDEGRDPSIVKFAYRLRLIKLKVAMLEPDVVAFSEIDAMNGSNSQEFFGVLNMMKDLGYAYEYFEKNNLKAGSAIFYREDQFECGDPQKRIFNSN